MSVVSIRSIVGTQPIRCYGRLSPTSCAAALASNPPAPRADPPKVLMSSICDVVPDRATILSDCGVTSYKLASSMPWLLSCGFPATPNWRVNRFARDLGIGANLLTRWRRALEAEGANAFPGKGVARDEEMARLKRDNLNSPVRGNGGKPAEERAPAAS